MGPPMLARWTAAARLSASAARIRAASRLCAAAGATAWTAARSAARLPAAAFLRVRRQRVVKLLADQPQ
jgi:hypothetical protein